MSNCENFKSPKELGLKICTSDIECYNGIGLECIDLPSNPTLNDVIASIDEEICSILSLFNGINIPNELHITTINPVAGGDNQWELVYNDASTSIIGSPYYILNQGSGENLIYDEAVHPTKIKSLDELDDNAGIIVSSTANTVDFNVKQYGRRPSLDFNESLTGLGTSYCQHSTPRFENAGGGVQTASKSGGGSTLSNFETQSLQLSTTPIDAYKSILYFNLVEDFTFTYNQLTYDFAVEGKMHFNIAFQLDAGSPSFPAVYFDPANTEYFHGNHSTATYDIYDLALDDVSNKLRRYSKGKVVDTLVQKVDGTTDPTWIGNGGVGARVFMRYPYIENLTDPSIGGVDVVLDLRLEIIGSIIVHHDTNTDFLSTITGIQNH